MGSPRPWPKGQKAGAGLRGQGGWGESRVNKVAVSIEDRKHPPPCLPLHGDSSRAEVMEAAWSRGPSFEKNR